MQVPDEPGFISYPAARARVHLPSPHAGQRLCDASVCDDTILWNRSTVVHASPARHTTASDRAWRQFYREDCHGFR